MICVTAHRAECRSAHGLTTEKFKEMVAMVQTVLASNNWHKKIFNGKWVAAGRR